jgi:ABC-2 type transport system permease protein
LQKILEIVPLTHGIKLLKMASMGLDMTGAYVHILVLLGVTIIGGVVSLVTFRWE